MLGFMAHGGHGCISVTSNVAPRLCAEFQDACLKGDFAAALKTHDKLMPLHTALFIETNPAPAKYALSLLGKCADTVRLPMVRLAEQDQSGGARRDGPCRPDQLVPRTRSSHNRAANPNANFGFKTGTRISRVASVPWIPKFAQSVPRVMANF